MIRAKVVEYLQRAEQLKEHMENQAKAKSAAVSVSAAGGKSEDG